MLSGRAPEQLLTPPSPRHLPPGAFSNAAPFGDHFPVHGPHPVPARQLSFVGFGDARKRLARMRIRKDEASQAICRATRSTAPRGPPVAAPRRSCWTGCLLLPVDEHVIAGLLIGVVGDIPHAAAMTSRVDVDRHRDRALIRPAPGTRGSCRHRPRERLDRGSRRCRRLSRSRLWPAARFSRRRARVWRGGREVDVLLAAVKHRRSIRWSPEAVVTVTSTRAASVNIRSI